jgi:hypothetical protein
LIVNDPAFADYDPAKEQYSRVFTWSGRDYAAGGRQLFPLNDVIPLGPPLVAPPPPVPITVSSLAVTAAEEERIITPV